MISTGEGPLWLSAIRDAFSRRVVAWETSAHADADLVLTTLEYALASHEVEPGKLVHRASGAEHAARGARLRRCSCSSSLNCMARASASTTDGLGRISLPRSMRV